MSPAWVAILISFAAFGITTLANFYIHARHEGKKDAALERMEEDIQGICQAVSTNKDILQKDHDELETLVLKIKSAVEVFTGRTVNGVSYRKRG